MESTSTTAFGGADAITTGAGSDLVIGGRYGDVIGVGAGNNLVIGDSGRVTAASTDGPQLAGIPMTFGLIETVQYGDGGVDQITALGGSDIVLGGHEGDDVAAGDGNNIVLGDDGRVDYTRADREPAAVGADTDPGDLDLIESLSTTLFGGADTITTGIGRDIILGGIGGDTIHAFASGVDLEDEAALATAGAADGNNIIIGDSGYIDWTADDSDAEATCMSLPESYTPFTRVSS